MKLALVLIVAAVISASFYADYKWRKWMANRRRDHNDRTDH